MTDPKTSFDKSSLEIYMCYLVMQLHTAGIWVVGWKSVGGNVAGTGTKSIPMHIST